MRSIPCALATDVSAEEIANRLCHGEVVLLPTETVYGLAAKHRAPALERIYELKGRPAGLNLPIVIGRLEHLSELGVSFNQAAEALVAAFWPGKLTMVMGFAPGSGRPEWLVGREEVAVRFPEVPLLRQVAHHAGPFLLTSANAHGRPTSSSAARAAQSLAGRVDFIVDGGELDSLPSSIVNVRLSPPVVERVGVISVAEIQEVLAEVPIDTPARDSGPLRTPATE